MKKILSLCLVLFSLSVMADMPSQDDYKNQIALNKALFAKDLSSENSTGVSSLEDFAKAYKKFLKRGSSNSQYSKKFKNELAKVEEWLEEKTISSDEDLWYNRFNSVYTQKIPQGTKFMYNRQFKGENDDEHYKILVTFELSAEREISQIKFVGSYREDN